MNINLFKTSALVKCASIAALALAFSGCSEDSGTNTVSINDDKTSTYTNPSELLKSSSSKAKSSSSVKAASSSSAKQSSSSAKAASSATAQSSSAKVAGSSSSVKAASSSATAKSSSAAAPKSSAATPASSAAVQSSSAAAPKSSAATPASSATVQSSSAAAPKSSAATPASSAAVQSSSAAAPKSSAATPTSSATVQSSSAAAPKSSAANNFYSDNWRQACLDKINEYRATENLAPLTLAPEAKQTCTDKEAADDLAANKAHGHFGDCGEWAQNSGPNFSTSWRKTAIEVSDAYLKMMWEDEKALVTSGERDPKKDEDYPYIGHYLNMKGNYKTVACGIALTADGKKGWFNVNFF